MNSVSWTWQRQLVGSRALLPQLLLKVLSACRCRNARSTGHPYLQSEVLRCLQDNVTPPGQARQISVGLAVLVAILILLPMTPESSDSVNSLPPSMYL